MLNSISILLISTSQPLHANTVYWYCKILICATSPPYYTIQLLTCNSPFIQPQYAPNVAFVSDLIPRRSDLCEYANRKGPLWHILLYVHTAAWVQYGYQLLCKCRSTWDIMTLSIRPNPSHHTKWQYIRTVSTTWSIRREFLLVLRFTFPILLHEFHS